MTVHYIADPMAQLVGFDAPMADCCGATLALLSPDEVTADRSVATCDRLDEAPAPAVTTPASQVTTDAGASEQSAAPVPQARRGDIKGKGELNSHLPAGGGAA